MIRDEDKIIPLSVFRSGQVERLFHRYCALRDSFTMSNPMWNRVSMFAGVIQNPLTGITPDDVAHLNRERSLIAEELPPALVSEWRGLVNETVVLFRSFGSLSDQERAKILDVLAAFNQPEETARVRSEPS